MTKRCAWSTAPRNARTASRPMSQKSWTDRTNCECLLALQFADRFLHFKHASELTALGDDTGSHPLQTKHQTHKMRRSLLLRCWLKRRSSHPQDIWTLLHVLAGETERKWIKQLPRSSLWPFWIQAPCHLSQQSNDYSIRLQKLRTLIKRRSPKDRQGKTWRVKTLEQS